MIKTEMIEAYITADGEKFFDEQEATKHEKKLAKLKYFKVQSGPDLTETGRFYCENYYEVESDGKQLWFMRNYCYEKMGSEYDFVQGQKYANAMCLNWKITELEGPPLKEPLIYIKEGEK